MARGVRSATGGRREDGRDSLLLRLEPGMSEAIRAAAKREERTITAVVVRAVRAYLKTEHGPVAVDEYCNSGYTGIAGR